MEVLWQPKSWADIETCVEWAEGCLTSFVALELKDEPYLLLCDNLNGQLADPFKAAMTKAGNSTLWFGPKGATHIWQPVDHHVGVRYKNMMSECYEEFLADREDHLPPPTAAERRVLLTQWAGKAYRALEKERDEKEATCKTLENPTAEQRSMFFKAFLRTGCLVDPAGKFDFEIHPHSSPRAGSSWTNNTVTTPLLQKTPTARVRFMRRARNKRQEVPRWTRKTKTTSPMKAAAIQVKTRSQSQTTWKLRSCRTKQLLL